MHKRSTHKTLSFATGLVGFALTVGGCTYQPIIDTAHPNFDPVAYDQDLAQCQAYAEQVDPMAQAAGGALLGAAVGAGLGAIGGSFYGDLGTGAAMGAALGGATGVAGGGLRGVQERNEIVRRCLAGRGYSVLN